VPSQALLLLNNELVNELSKRWASKVIGSAGDPQARVQLMYRTAFAREPERHEIDEILSFTKSQAELHAVPGVDALTIEQRAWADVAHVLFNSPEFIYVK
jgi:hypothetical protein